MNKLFNKFLGDEKQPDFPKTEFADCAVSINEKNDTLSMNPMAMKTIRNLFGRVVSLTGNPGTGKSTLTSTVYNIMRGDKTQYFAISDGMESFTKGIWALNTNIKTMMADKDQWKNRAIDVLDLEGLANSNAIHYLVVATMALSDAMVVCNTSKRFNFDALNTIIAGIKLYREKRITLPPPTIYLQVKFNKKGKLKISKGNEVDTDGFVAYIYQRYPDLKGIDVRAFSLDWDDDEDDDDRFQDCYIKSVKRFMDDIVTIPDKDIAIEDRVKYATAMVEALNNKSPDMIVKLNYKFFKDAVDQITKEAEKAAIKKIKTEAELESNKVSKKLSFDQFCANIYDKGRYFYGESIRKQAMELSFYDANDGQFNKLLADYHDKQKYSVFAAKFCRDSYDAAIQKLKSSMTTKGNALKKENDTLFNSFVDAEVNKAIGIIKFGGNTSLPYNVRSNVQRKRGELRKEIIEKTQEMVELENDYLSMDILTKRWEVKKNELEADWEQRKTKALGANKRKVITSGDHKCGDCGTNHSVGVTDKDYPNSLYYWVDSQTKCCINDVSKKLWFGAENVCCGNCGKQLDAKIVPI